jgi:hypothetical protein
MSTTKPHLYVNSKGYLVTHHSYSGSTSFNFCPRKYYLERVQGWSEKQERAAMKFGIALEAGVTFWHQRGQDTATAVAEFVRLWGEYKDKPYIYSKPEKDWESMCMTGSELIKLYAIKYPTLPYTVPNPKDAFQVCEPFEVFPGTKLAGIEFTSYIDMMVERKADGAPEIVDIKTSGKDIPELTMLDPQLRSYSWVKKKVPWVAFLWFRKMGREIAKGDKVTLLENYAGLEAGTAAVVMGTDGFGAYVTAVPKIEEEMNTLFVGKSKAVELSRNAYIATNGSHVLESVITKQRVQFMEAYISQESADDIGRKIKRDIVNIARANETEDWTMNSGVRFPDERCPNCSMRGICSNNPSLRDALVTRKQLEEFDFGNESE